MISLLLQLWCTEAVAEEVDEQPKLSFEELGWVPPFQVAGANDGHSPEMRVPCHPIEPIMSVPVKLITTSPHARP